MRVPMSRRSAIGAGRSQVRGVYVGASSKPGAIQSVVMASRLGDTQLLFPPTQFLLQPCAIAIHIHSVAGQMVG